SHHLHIAVLSKVDTCFQHAHDLNYLHSEYEVIDSHLPMLMSREAYLQSQISLTETELQHRTIQIACRQEEMKFISLKRKYARIHEDVTALKEEEGKIKRNKHLAKMELQDLESRILVSEQKAMEQNIKTFAWPQIEFSNESNLHLI